jgi:hypothetical protein
MATLKSCDRCHTLKSGSGMNNICELSFANRDSNMDRESRTTVDLCTSCWVALREFLQPQLAPEQK